MKRRLIAVRAKQKKRFDRQRRKVRFVIGDLVWVHRPLRKKGRSQNLLHPFFGPFKIEERTNDLNYVVVPFNDKKKTRDRVHVTDLKPYYARHEGGTRTKCPLNPGPNEGTSNVQSSNGPGTRTVDWEKTTPTE